MVAITVANGSDNIGVYLPLFARASQAQTLVTLVIFALMLGLWCAIAWRLVQLPGPSGFLQRHGPRFMPALLFGLGLYLLVDARIFSERAPALLALLCLGAMVLSLAGRPAWPLPARIPLLFTPIPAPGSGARRPGAASHRREPETGADAYGLNLPIFALLDAVSSQAIPTALPAISQAELDKQPTTAPTD